MQTARYYYYRLRLFLNSILCCYLGHDWEKAPGVHGLWRCKRCDAFITNKEKRETID